jgi:hypothetical protein
MEQHPPEPATLSGHEPPAPKMQAIVYSLVGLVLAIVGSLLLVGALIHFLSRDRPAGMTSDQPIPAGVPTLDPYQADDLQQLQWHEQKLLTEYAWVDRKTGIARVPIRRAIEIVAQKADKSATSSAGKQGQP